MRLKKSGKRKGNLREFPQKKTLTPEEKAFIVMLFVEHEDSVELVKEQFERAAHRKISLELLVQVRAEHSERIMARLEEMRENLGESYGAKTSQRLKELKWVLREAKKRKLRYTIKTQDGIDERTGRPIESFKEFRGPDLKAVIAAVMGMETVMSNSRKFALAYGKQLTGEFDESETDEDEIEFEDDEKISIQ